MNILTQLQNELAEVDVTKVKWPDAELKEGQTVIGQASDDVVRLVGLRAKLADELHELEQQHERLCPPNDETRERHDQLKTQLRLLADKAELVNDLLWLTIKYEHSEVARKNRVGLAKDRRIWWDNGGGPEIEVLGIHIVGPSVDMDDNHPLKTLLGGLRRSLGRRD